jgi:toxin ParE1/3/4
MKVQWSHSSRDDMRQIFEYIAGDSPAAAHRILRHILGYTERLSRFPLSGRTGRKAHTREMMVSGTPYFLIYSVEKGLVTVLRVYHSSREWPA